MALDPDFPADCPYGPEAVPIDEMTATLFREHDLEVIRRMHAVRDHGVEVLASTSKELREELAELFAEDEQQLAPAREAARVAHAGSPGRNPG